MFQNGQDRDLQNQDSVPYCDNTMVDDLVAKILDDDACLVGNVANDYLSEYVHKVLFISNLYVSLTS
jgi:hypothetical protein